jgi:hypothetical protein
MSPAPRVITTSPGWTRAASERATSVRGPTHVTSRWPCARTAAASASLVAPAIGCSPAAYTSASKSTSARLKARVSSSKQNCVRV